ncbi:MAG TPA: ArsA family ATPase [Intrasporangiaceae bacterium]|nr:ArsA family ATPase [Intrasporangiaceae bacterium]
MGRAERLPRVVVCTGKGGVGKTTTAAALGVDAARDGARTLLMSTDGAHSLGDALGVDLRNGPAEVETRLTAEHVSAAHGLSDAWRVVQDYLIGLLDDVGVDPAIAEELTSLPGADEIAALVTLRERVRAGSWDVVIVDCAPTAETLRLLALPDSLAWHLRRWLPDGSTWRPAAAAALGLPLPGPAVLAAITRWHAQMSDLKTVLRAPGSTIRLVTTPEKVVTAEARRTWTSLSLFGFEVDAVHVNRVFPAGSEVGSEWISGWNTAQADGIREVHESFSGLPVVTMPYLPAEPIGPDALAALAESCGEVRLTGERLLREQTTPALTVRETGTGYALSLRVPFVAASDVRLGRRGDDLLIDLAGQHRVVTLPAALAPLQVSGAGVKQGRLVVTFIRTVGPDSGRVSA